MRKKLIFFLFAALLLFPWPVAYAYENNLNTLAVSSKEIQVEVAAPSAQPTWDVFQRAVGGVSTPGDLFYIDASEDPEDLSVNLHFTNTHELIDSYRYMVLEVGIYYQDDAGHWQKASGPTGKLMNDSFITLSNGQVSLRLPGYTRYKLTIDNGCFYCTGGNADGSSLSPQFYLDVSH